MRTLSSLMLVGIITFSRVMGHTSYQQDIPNGDKVYRQGRLWSAVGHVTLSGPGTDSPGLNPFGDDFQKHNHFWTRELCEMDSDGDGQTNGLELGDPHCEWLKDQLPNRTRGISHPGYADSMWVPEAEDGSDGGALSGAPAPTSDRNEDHDGLLGSTRGSTGSGGRGGREENDNDDRQGGSTGSYSGRGGRGGRGSRGGDTGGRSPVSTSSPRTIPQRVETTTTMPPGGTHAKKFYSVAMTFAKSVDEIRADQADILARVALILKVQTEQVSIISINEGSAVVTFKLETDDGEFKDAASVKSALEASDALDAYGLQSDTLEAAEASPPEEKSSQSAAQGEESNLVVIAVVISLVVLVAGVAVVVVCVLMRGRSDGKKTKKRKHQAEAQHRQIYEAEEGEGFDELQQKTQQAPQSGYPNAHINHQQPQPQAYPQPQQVYQGQQGPKSVPPQFPVHAHPQNNQSPSNTNSSSYHSSQNSGYPLQQHRDVQPAHPPQYSPRETY